MLNIFRLKNMGMLRAPENTEGVALVGAASTQSEPSEVNTDVQLDSVNSDAINVQEEQVEWKNPFDFTAISDEDDVVEDSSKEEVQDSEYVLELGAAFGGSEDTLNMITRTAQTNGIEAKVASAFVNQVCEQLLEAERSRVDKAQQELKNDWKGSFDTNMKETMKFINNVVNSNNLSEDTARALMNPQVFRFVNAIRQSFGEGRTSGTKSTARMSKEAEIQDIMENPKNPHYQALFTPGHKDNAKAREYFNNLVGAKIF